MCTCHIIMWCPDHRPLHVQKRLHLRPGEHQPTCLARRAPAHHATEPREALRQLSVCCLRLLHGLGCLDSLRPQPPHLEIASPQFSAQDALHTVPTEGSASACGSRPSS